MKHAFKKATAVGDKMPDGTIYAGDSPDTGKPMYMTPAGLPLTLKWKEAKKYAAAFHARGYQDWRLPSQSELNVLFKNRAAIGGFNVTGSARAGWYWSSTEYRFIADGAWGQRFDDGRRAWSLKGLESSLRLVRS